MNEFQSIATVLCSETGIGISAKTIISAFANLDYYYHDIPRDNDDLKRCLYLLSFFSTLGKKHSPCRKKISRMERSL